jgi:hypothetical protein
MSVVNKQTFAIPTGGTTDSIAIADLPDVVHLTGSGTMSGNYVLQVTGTVSKASSLWVLYDANMESTSGTYTVTVLGQVLPDSTLDAKKCMIYCTYDGSAWDVSVLANIAEDNSIPDSALEINPGGVEAFDYTSAATTAVTSEETLITLTLAADVLDTDGDYVELFAYGTTAANGNTKTIRLKQTTVGKTFATNATTTAPNNTNWMLYGKVHRLNSTTGLYVGWVEFDGVAREGFVYSSDTATWGSSMEFQITGQNGTASANDIVAQAGTMTIHRYRN